MVKFASKISKSLESKIFLFLCEFQLKLPEQISNTK